MKRAQAYHNCPAWVNYFIHTGHLHIEGLKMSKSLKNFITIDVSEHPPRPACRRASAIFPPPSLSFFSKHVTDGVPFCVLFFPGQWPCDQQEILQKYSARQLRLAFLTQLWNSKVDFSESLMTGEVRGIEITFNVRVPSHSLRRHRPFF